MRTWSIARRFFVGQLIFVLCLSGGVSWVMYLDAERQQYGESAARMQAMSTTLANDPFVIDAAQRPDASALLQPYAREVMEETRADFITIMAPDRTRFTHSDPTEIGGAYIGSIGQALDGRTYTETYTGTLGPSVRTIAPVMDEDGDVVAMVSSGVTLSSVSEALEDRLPLVVLTAAGALSFGALASWWLSRRLRKLTLGQGPEALSRMFVFYEAVLHSVREGMVLVSSTGELVLYNDQAATLLNLPPARNGGPTPVADLSLPASLQELLAGGRRASDELHLTTDRVLVVNQEPALPPGSGARPAAQSMGTVTTLRDHTEIEELTGEVQSLRTVTDALRAQTHEHSNRLHTIVSLIELGRGQEAAEFAASDLQQSQALTDTVVDSINEPYLSALLVGKAAQANERGVELSIDSSPGLEPPKMNPADLVTIVGNLLDNSFDAVAGLPEARVAVAFGSADTDLTIRVTNNGPALDAAKVGRIFELGFSTKPSSEGHGIGLSLVRQACTRLSGRVHVESFDGGTAFVVRLPLSGGAGHE